jgi:hypothetical protein
MKMTTKTSRRKLKWARIDQDAATHLVALADSPGHVVELPILALPQKLAQMPGAVSYFGRANTAQLTPFPGLTVGGEIVVIRTQAGSGKAYNYAYGTSSNGELCFQGLPKDSRYHHFPIKKPIVYFVLVTLDC